MQFRSRFALAASAFVLVASAPAYVYQYDDGTSEDNLTTSGPATFTALFLTNYNATAAGQTITSIDIVWGSPANPNLPNGLTADVLLLSDPNNDGDPADAAILQSVTTVTANVGTDTFNSYAITPTTLSPGTSFFVGAFLHDVPNGSTWVAMDNNATGMSSRNWWNVTQPGPLGPDNSLSIFGFDNYTFMVRANAAPEPASLLALGAGAAAFLKRRARKKV